MKKDRTPLPELLKDFENIRLEYLTADENAIIELKILNKTDKTIAKLLQLSVPAINIKRNYLYKLIPYLVWWENARPLLSSSFQKKYGTKTILIIDMAMHRMKQNEIAQELQISTRQVYTSIIKIMSKEKKIEEMFKCLRRGYKVSEKEM